MNWTIKFQNASLLWNCYSILLSSNGQLNELPSGHPHHHRWLKPDLEYWRGNSQTISKHQDPLHFCPNTHRENIYLANLHKIVFTSLMHIVNLISQKIEYIGLNYFPQLLSPDLQKSNIWKPKIYVISPQNSSFII